MLSIFVCDDNRYDREKYRKLILKCAEKINVEVCVKCFLSGEDLLLELCEFKNYPDILYLDIFMGKINGMQAAQRIRNLNLKTEIVFLTSSAEYMYQAFDVEAVHYLFKNEITEKKFQTVFQRALDRTEYKKSAYFICEFNGAQAHIPLEDIFYFEVMNRIIVVHCRSDYDGIRFYGKMNQLEEQLAEKGFVRIHRSYLVNLPYIMMFNSRKLTLKSGIVLSVGRNYTENIKKTFSRYLSERYVQYENLEQKRGTVQ